MYIEQSFEMCKNNIINFVSLPYDWIRKASLKLSNETFKIKKKQILLHSFLHQCGTII